MPKFSFDFSLCGAATVTADTLDEAREILRRRLDAADALLDVDQHGQGGMIAEVSMDGKAALYAIDFEEACECPGCGAVEGTDDWGTVGDGFDGYCPSCADERDGEYDEE